MQFKCVQIQTIYLGEEILAPLRDIGSVGKCAIVLALSHQREFPSLPVERMHKFDLSLANFSLQETDCARGYVNPINQYGKANNRMTGKQKKDVRTARSSVAVMNSCFQILRLAVGTHGKVSPSLQ